MIVVVSVIVRMMMVMVVIMMVVAMVVVVMIMVLTIGENLRVVLRKPRDDWKSLANLLLHTFAAA